MKVLGRIIFYGILLILILLSRETIVELVVDRYTFSGEVEPPINNEYTVPTNMSHFLSSHETDVFWADSYDHLFEIIFMVVNSGQDEFTFYCTKEYDRCFHDLGRITQDQQTLTYINNFVHPYNTYEKLNIEFDDSSRRVVLKISKLYSDDEINKLETEIDTLIAKVTNNGMSVREKIKAVHDEILENSIYDRARADSIINKSEFDINNQSHKATGPILYGQAICGGYSDALAIVLHKFGIPNYRISNDEHIWNYVYLNNSWYHIDLTWNNPSTHDGQELIIETYFLITTKQLKDINDDAHDYDVDVFVEAR